MPAVCGVDDEMPAKRLVNDPAESSTFQMLLKQNLEGSLRRSLQIAYVLLRDSTHPAPSGQRQCLRPGTEFGEQCWSRIGFRHEIQKIIASNIVWALSGVNPNSVVDNVRNSPFSYHRKELGFCCLSVVGKLYAAENARSAKVQSSLKKPAQFI